MRSRLTRGPQTTAATDLRLDLLVSQIDRAVAHIHTRVMAARALQREGRQIDPSALVDELMDVRLLLAPPPATDDGGRRG